MKPLLEKKTLSDRFDCKQGFKIEREKLNYCQIHIQMTLTSSAKLLANMAFLIIKLRYLSTGHSSKANRITDRGQNISYFFSSDELYGENCLIQCSTGQRGYKSDWLLNECAAVPNYLWKAQQKYHYHEGLCECFSTLFFVLNIYA